MLGRWLTCCVRIALAIAVCLGCASNTTAQETAPPFMRDVARLVSAYPDFLDRIEGNSLIWKDGTRMPIDDGKGVKDAETRLQSADIKDMFFAPYPAGGPAVAPDVDVDPGRARYEPFFHKMYGDCRTGGAQMNLVDVVWLPRKWGKPLRVTRVNGVAEKLKAVSREIDALPARFDEYVRPSAGTFNCRTIAGTNRGSAHGLGIAIDIATRRSHYWRWEKPGANGRHAYRNDIPMEIVRIFEKHGFIWGGRWYHYDTMHFEYRPELLPGP